MLGRRADAQPGGAPPGPSSPADLTALRCQEFFDELRALRWHGGVVGTEEWHKRQMPGSRAGSAPPALVPSCGEGTERAGTCTAEQAGLSGAAQLYDMAAEDDDAEEYKAAWWPTSTPLVERKLPDPMFSNASTAASEADMAAPWPSVPALPGESGRASWADLVDTEVPPAELPRPPEYGTGEELILIRDRFREYLASGGWAAARSVAMPLRQPDAPRAPWKLRGAPRVLWSASGELSWGSRRLKRIKN